MATLYEDLTDAIASELEAITNIGNVFKRRVYVTNETALKEKFGITIGGVKQIRGWEVVRVTTPAPTGTFAEYRHRVYNFRIEGWMGLDDSENTHRTFQTLLDNVLDNLDSTNWNASGGETVPLGVSAVITSGPAILTTYEEAFLAGYLCHHGIIEFPVEVERDVSGF